MSVAEMFVKKWITRACDQETDLSVQAQRLIIQPVLLVPRQLVKEGQPRHNQNKRHEWITWQEIDCRAESLSVLG